MRSRLSNIFILLLLVISILAEDTDRCGEVVIDSVRSVADALACLRSVPTPSSYLHLCDAVVGALDSYPLLPFLESGVEFPSTALDLPLTMKAVCLNPPSSTFDFHLAMASASSAARDVNTGWTTSAAAQAYRFIYPATIAAVKGPSAELEYFLLPNNLIFGNPAVRAAAAEVVGEPLLTQIEHLAGLPVGQLNGLYPSAWTSTINTTVGRTRSASQSRALLVSLFAELGAGSGTTGLLAGLDPTTAIKMMEKTVVVKVETAKQEFLELKLTPLAISTMNFSGEDDLAYLETIPAPAPKAAPAPAPETLSATGADTETDVCGHNNVVKGTRGLFLGSFISVYRRGTYTMLQVLSAPATPEDTTAWLDELDTAVKTVRETGDDLDGVVVLDVRMVSGRLVPELTNILAGIIAASNNTARASAYGSALWPRTTIHTRYRAGMLAADPAQRRREVFLPSHECPTQYAGWAGRPVRATNAEYTDGDFGWTPPLFWRAPRAGDKCHGNIDEDVWNKYIQVAETQYNLRNSIRNTLVLTGSLTAGGAADLAAVLRGGNHVLAVATAGRAGDGIDQIGMGGGGDRVDVHEMLDRRPDLLTRWTGGSLPNWPGGGGWVQTGAAHLHITPRDYLKHGTTPREFTKHQLDAVLGRILPLPEHVGCGLVSRSWHYGTVAEAAEVLKQVEEAELFDACYADAYKISDALSTQETYFGTDCRGVARPVDCRAGFEPRYAEERPNELFCKLVECGNAMAYSPELGICTSHSSAASSFWLVLVVSVPAFLAACWSAVWVAKGFWK